MGANSSLPSIEVDAIPEDVIDQVVAALVEDMEHINYISDRSFASNDESHHQGPPPASKSAIKKLQRFKLQEVSEDNEMCVVCSENFQVGDTITKMPCSHLFHCHCANEWLRRHCTCPTCRYEINVIDPGFDKGRTETTKRQESTVAHNIATDASDQQQEDEDEDYEQRALEDLIRQNDRSVIRERVGRLPRRMRHLFRLRLENSTRRIRPNQPLLSS